MMVHENNSAVDASMRQVYVPVPLDAPARSTRASTDAGPINISLVHLDRMTDSTGLIQHAIYGVPRRESGYTIDDNARALRLCTRLWHHLPNERMMSRITAYLSLLEYARHPAGGFHNLLSYQRNWQNTDGEGDCQGQAVLALAEVLGGRLPDGHRILARELIEAGLPTFADLRSLRAQAYVVLAWGHLSTFGTKPVVALESVARSAAQRLVDCFQRSQRPDWQWFESRMTYANAVLPHALFVAAKCWPTESFLEVAETSFSFLDRVTTTAAPSPLARDKPNRWASFYEPIGNDGWYSHSEEKARYDQQPVEAATMADAARTAFHLLGEEKYLTCFQRSRNWFHGDNSLGVPLIDVHLGACYDGLQPSGINQNQGAESTLAYLWTELHHGEIQAGQSEPLQLVVDCL